MGTRAPDTAPAPLFPDPAGGAWRRAVARQNLARKELSHFKRCVVFQNSLSPCGNRSREFIVADHVYETVFLTRPLHRVRGVRQAGIAKLMLAQ